MRKESGLISLQQEIDILRSVKGHKHIVNLYDVYLQPDKCFLVMEYLSDGDLLSRIKTLKKYTEEDAKHACAHILKALEYCHDRKIAHRDIKPDNFLIGIGKK